MSIMQATEQRVWENYGKLPLAFIPNLGQMDEDVHYEARGSGWEMAFTAKEVVFTFMRKMSDVRRETSSHEEMTASELAVQRTVLAFRFLGANSEVKIEGQDEGIGKVNYFVGNDPTKWMTHLPIYHEIVYRKLWPGVDLFFRGKSGQSKYTFVVQPGALIENIQFTYDGAQALSFDEEGNLQVHTPYGILVDERPISHQEIDGERVPVSSSFVVQADENGEKRYGFAVGRNYDPRFPLLIDPGLIYSTYLGGSKNDGDTSIAVDTAGNAYVTGFSSSADFPTTVGAFQTIYGSGLSNAFVTKLDPTGSTLVYSTYLGGSGVDGGNGLAIDATGNAYIIGQTSSTNFPITTASFQTSLAGGMDTFVTKLDPTGSALIYSTYLGGSGNDLGAGIAVDTVGNAYVTGGTDSTDFPTTPASFQPTLPGVSNAFVTKLNPTGSALIYSTYLGGSGDDGGRGIGVDALENAYIVGFTNSTDFPTNALAFQATLAGNTNAFVTKLNPAGSAFVYSTYLGGSVNDQGLGIAVDVIGDAYITGFASSANFPITVGAFQTALAGDANVFVTKLNSAGSALIYSTYLGGSNDDEGLGIAIDDSGNAYVGGFTQSIDFPVTPGAVQSALAGPSDAFVAQLNPTGSHLVYSTYLGGSTSDEGTGIAVDTVSNIYVTGQTDSTDFPIVPGAFQSKLPGVLNAFVTKISPITIPITISPPLITCSPNITVPNQLGQCGAIVKFPSPTVFDPCSGGFTVSCNPNSGSFFPVGINSVTCMVTDACGGSATCPFTVTVVDTEPPTIICPDDMMVGINPSQSGTIVDYPNPTVFDNCPEGVTWLCTPSSGSFFPVGTNTVTCIAADAAGNTSECSFTITVFTTLATECIRVQKVYDWVIVPIEKRVQIPLP
jgi:hypothetical protein